jgi:hypothetical protein
MSDRPPKEFKHGLKSNLVFFSRELQSQLKTVVNSLLRSEGIYLNFQEKCCCNNDSEP